MESREYLIGNGLLTFIAVIFSGIFALMLESFSGSSEIFKFMTFVVGAITGFIWLYRFKRSWFHWLPRASCIVVFVVCNVIAFIAWYEVYFAVSPSSETYQTLGYKSTPNSSFLSIFGPLLLMFFIARPCLRFGFFGRSEVYPQPGNEKRLRQEKHLSYLLLGPSFLMSAYVAIHNFSLTTIIDILEGMSTGIAIILVILAAGAGLIFVFSIWEKISKNRALKDLQSIPKNAIEEIEQCYQELIKDEPVCLAHYMKSKGSNGQYDILSSKVGGKPYAESLNDWPTSGFADSPDHFCIQLALSSSIFPSQWRGRLITVYLTDWQVVVKSYGSPSIEKWVDVTQNKSQFPERLLSNSEIPFKPLPDEDDEEAWEDFFDINTPEYVLRNSENITNLLARYTKHSERVLTEILANAGVYDSDAIDSILEAGAPHFIQGEHEPNCELCGNAMRFLFEFGEVLEPEFTIGDAAMTYVFGCDQHPSHCVGFVDSH